MTMEIGMDENIIHKGVMPTAVYPINGIQIRSSSSFYEEAMLKKSMISGSVIFVLNLVGKMVLTN